MNDVLEAPLCLPPHPLRNLSRLRLPEGTCDAHFHAFDPNAALVSPRSYTPQMENVAGWLALADSFGIERGILVQPSVYGTDNHVLIAALAAHPNRLRGVVVIHGETPTDELIRLSRLGVRGVRINLRNKGGIGFDALEQLTPRIRPLGWHVQFQVGPESILAAAELAARNDLVGVIDHLAFMPLNPPGSALEDLHRALDTGCIYVKISAPYRLSDAAHHANYKHTVSTLAVRQPTRILWGTDWPHTELFDAVPDDDDLISLSLAAVPTQFHRQVFVENAQNLYFSH